MHISKINNTLPQLSKIKTNTLKKSLIGLTVLGSSLLHTTSCSFDPDLDEDIYIKQCPKEDNPMLRMDNYEQKANYLMNLLGILPTNSSINDVKQINVEKTNGDKITLILEKTSDNGVNFKYILNTTDGTTSISTMNTLDANNGYIRAIVEPNKNIQRSYDTYTKSSAYQNSLYITSNHNTETNNAILKKTNKGFLKINMDNSKENIKIDVKI